MIHHEYGASIKFSSFKGTVIQNEKALINDLKSILKISHSSYL